MYNETVKNTLLELVSQRGWTVLEEYDDPMHFIAKKPCSALVYVIFEVIEQVNKNFEKSILKTLEESELKHIIVPYEKTTPQVEKNAEKLSELGYTIELFYYKDLMYNPTKHYLVPKHVLLTPEEKSALSKEIDIANLPVLTKGDAISKFYGFSKGNVVKIERKDSIVYRLVK